jgi:guanylate kinase
MTHEEKVWVKPNLINVPFVVISGPSAGGKSNFIQICAERIKYLQLLIKHTTRNIRHDEVREVSYYFVDKTQFFEIINKKNAIVFAYRYNTFYGLSIVEVENAIKLKKIPLFILDVHLALKFKKHYPKTLLIFVGTSEKIIIDRLLKRNDIQESKEYRIELIKEELELSKNFNIILEDNYNIDEVIIEIEKKISLL